MEHLAELFLKNFTKIMEKPGMKMTSSNDGFTQVFPKANLE